MSLSFTGHLTKGEVITTSMDCLIRRFAAPFISISVFVTCLYGVAYVAVRGPNCQFVAGPYCDPAAILQPVLALWCSGLFFTVLLCCYLAKIILIMMTAKGQVQDVRLDLEQDKITLTRGDGKTFVIPARTILIRQGKTCVFGYSRTKSKVFRIFGLPHRVLSQSDIDMIGQMYGKARWRDYPNQ